MTKGIKIRRTNERSANRKAEGVAAERKSDTVRADILAANSTIVKVTRERDEARAQAAAMREALPGTFDGKRYAVYVRTSMTPNTPIALFKYRDQAFEWARRVYGQFDGWSFSMVEGVEVVDMCDDDGANDRDESIALRRTIDAGAGPATGQHPTKPPPSPHPAPWLRDLEALVAMGAKTVDIVTAKGAVEEARKEAAAYVDHVARKVDGRLASHDSMTVAHELFQVAGAIRAAGKVSP